SKLKNSTERIVSSIGNRPWIADIDEAFLLDCHRKIGSGLGVREVHQEICSLATPDDGYKNWFEFLKDIPEAIPTLQLIDLTQLEQQMQLLESLSRGVAARLPLARIANYLPHILNLFSQRENGNFLILLDLESVDSSSMENAPA